MKGCSTLLAIRKTQIKTTPPLTTSRVTVQVVWEQVWEDMGQFVLHKVLSESPQW